MTHAFGSLDELGDGPGFRKVRGPLRRGLWRQRRRRPAGLPGIHDYHDTQDEPYFVHKRPRRCEVEGEERILGPGGLFHVASMTPGASRRGDEELACRDRGKDGDVERDGHVMSDEDL